MSKFWRDWLMAWCVAVGVFGLVLAGAGLEPTTAPSRLLLKVLGGGREVVFNPALHFSVALMGCVTLGWGLTLAAAIRAADQLGARGGPTWRGVTVSVVVWFALDSLLSVITGFGLNAASNAVFLAAFLLPLLRTKVWGLAAASL